MITAYEDPEPEEEREPYERDKERDDYEPDDCPQYFDGTDRSWR